MSLGARISEFLDGNRPDAPIWLRLLTGAAFGAVFSVFVPIIALVWLIGGAEVQTRSALIRADLLTLLYPLGAIISGALFVALVGYCRSRVAASISGIVALAPWFVAIGLCFNRGYSTWTPDHTVTTTICTLLIGGGLGWFTAESRFHRRVASISLRPNGQL
jgi:hypothetical protein